MRYCVTCHKESVEDGRVNCDTCIDRFEEES